MIYKVSFVIDNDCRQDEHVAIVSAESGTKAIGKVTRYVVAKLKYDEFMPVIGSEPIESNDILYCSYKEESTNDGTENT